LTLLSLDIETSGEQRDSAGNAGQASGSGSGSDRSGGDDQEPVSAADDSTSQSTTVVLPNGALVNVLA
jgi:hypothetical protein